MSSFLKQMRDAERRVAEFDEIEGYKPRDLSTILGALLCGLKNPESGAAFDAYVMLLDLARTESNRKN